MVSEHKPRLMSPKEAAEATTMSRTLLSIMAEEGKFPAPVQIGVKRKAYVREEVENWIEKQIGARAS